MRIVLNGADCRVPDGSSVGDVVAITGAPDRGVAVAVDSQVVPRSRWTDTVRGGAVIEVLTAVQGG
jgi:sulfur carrier protein